MRLHNRVIRPGFWTDTELIRNLPMSGRMYYMGLVQLAEDSGCLEDDVLAHKIHLFPGDADVTPDSIEEWRNKLVELGKLIPYEADGKRCMYLKNFHKHQRLRNPAAPDLPLPSWVRWNDPHEEIVNGKTIKRNGFYDVSNPYEADTDLIPNSHSREPEPEPEPEPDLEEKRESPDEPAPPSPQDIMGLWNDVCSDVLPSCQKMTDKRRKHINARLSESQERKSRDWWQSYFARIRASPFCCGDNDRGWRATFEWAIGSEDNVVKVLEGKYDRQGGAQHGRNSTSSPGGVSTGPGVKYANVYGKR